MHDPTDPVGQVPFTVLAMVAESVEGLLQRLFDRAPDGLVVMRASDGLIVLVNRGVRLACRSTSGSGNQTSDRSAAATR